ncbi:MAG: PH domain-containing protein [Candidatus Electryonea clarkiae]|nr:PH domain-containing protein [Candidatus Electryonea clarkiae]MDP8286436.1 PH domain-containing protein [Candidatus Electryonea clarkiae]
MSDEIILKPEKQTLSLWMLVWFLSSIPVLIGLLIGAILITDIKDSIIMWICFAGCAITAFVFLIWIPLFLKRLEYSIGNDSIHLKSGVLWRKRVTIPYVKVTNIDITQGPFERSFGIGQVKVQTAGASGQTKAEMVMVGIKETEVIRDEIFNRIRKFSSPQMAEKSEIDSSDTRNPQERIIDELKAIRVILEKHNDKK